MSKKKRIETIHNQHDVEQYARQMDWEILQGKRHGMVVSPKGKCPYPRHNGDYCNGTRWAIIKTLALMGMVLAIIWQLG
jgi:hypothetical protein